MTVTNLSQILTPELTLERLRGYLIEAAKEFSFTGFSTYYALAKRTLQLADRGDAFKDISEADREQMLSEPNGLLVRQISGMIPNTPHFPSAWRFVRSKWDFSDKYRSEIAEVLGLEDADGPFLQKLTARAAGVPIPLDAARVPLEYRRER